MMRGRQVLTVTRVSGFTSESGIRFMQACLANDEGATLLQNFPLTEGGLKILNSFARACGLTEKDREEFDPTMLVGKKILGTVFVNEAGYFAVKNWAPVPKSDDSSDLSDDPDLPDLPSLSHEKKTQQALF
ncbi:hypothetical protein HQ520_03050 [bacterium]|nr:hypothetical protein [bacterium]